MNSNTTKIVAVVAVVVIIVAAAAVVLMGGGDKGSDKGTSIESQLQIRGNANGDYTIDSKDMEILDAVMGGTSKLADHPLADVNNDGAVDATDKQLLQDLIDRKAGTDVYVMCLDVNGNDTVVKAEYPLRDVVTYATNMQMPVLFANGGKHIAGYFTSSYKVAEGSINPDATALGGSNRSIPDSAWTAFTELDVKLESGVGAFLTDYSAVAQITAPRQADLEAAGIPLIIYPSANSTDEITTVLTLGFLFGGDCESLGVKYAETSWAVMDEIDSKVGKLSDSERTSYICCTMWVYVCENDSTYNTSPATAGGIPYYKVNPVFASKYAGDGSTKMNDTEALSNYTDVGAIINNRSMDWGVTDMEKTVLSCWEHDTDSHKTYEYFTGMEEKLVFVNNLLPGAAKLAYMAHALYGDQFSMGWADGVLQQFIDMGTEPLKGQTLDTIPAYIGYEEYQAAKA